MLTKLQIQYGAHERRVIASEKLVTLLPHGLTDLMEHIIENNNKVVQKKKIIV